MFDPSHTSRIALFVSLNIFVIGCTKAPQGVTVRCEEDEYVEDGECKECPAGSTNTSDAYAGGDTKCEPTRCGVNQRVEEHRCVDCEPGTTRTAGDEATGANTFCEVSVCGADEHVQGGECVACPAGTTNEPGDRRTDGDSPCEPVLCQLNEHVESNACVVCEPGTTNDAGDDSSAGDTACDVTTCELDHFVESNTCVPCPDDTINDAGDAANGPDSSCRDAICRRNERVSLRQCVPCAQDMINLPGDHAALGDTSCTPSVVALEAEGGRTCSILANGEVWCWGNNLLGELGQDGITSNSSPEKVENLPHPAVQLGLGIYHTCVLTEAGEVYCWGIDLNTLDETLPTPRKVEPLPTDIAQLSSGSLHNCVLTSNRAVYCWGNNHGGVLGVNETMQPAHPVKVEGLPAHISKLIGGPANTCALTIDEELWCWGANNPPKPLFSTDANTAIPRPTLVSIDDDRLRPDTLTLSAQTACALSRDGEVFCKGRDLLARQPAIDQSKFVKVEGLPKDITTLDIDLFTACALSKSEGLICWGILPGEPQDAFRFHLPTRVEDAREPIEHITLSLTHGCVLYATGNVACWGSNEWGQLGDHSQLYSARPHAIPLLAPNVTKLSAGANFTCSLHSNNNVNCWGSTAETILQNNTLEESVTPFALDASASIHSIEVGAHHACALTFDGDVYCWGNNERGQLGDDTTLPRTSPRKVLGLNERVVQLSAGKDHTCGVTAQGSILCWGAQLQHDETPPPYRISGLSSHPIQLTSGDHHACALLQNNDVMCWGSNRFDQIDASIPETKVSTPLEKTGFSSGIASLSAGGNHTCAVLFNGSIQCWGNNQDGQLGGGNTTPNDELVTTPPANGFVYTQVSANIAHTCAVRSDGTIWCWGNNKKGRFRAPSSEIITPPTQIMTERSAKHVAAGEAHTCALFEDGLVKCWGENSQGQQGTKREYTSHTFLIDTRFE